MCNIRCESYPAQSSRSANGYPSFVVSAGLERTCCVHLHILDRGIFRIRYLKMPKPKSSFEFAELGNRARQPRRQGESDKCPPPSPPYSPVGHTFRPLKLRHRFPQRPILGPFSATSRVQWNEHAKNPPDSPPQSPKSGSPPPFRVRSSSACLPHLRAHLAGNKNGPNATERPSPEPSRRLDQQQALTNSYLDRGSVSRFHDRKELNRSNSTEVFLYRNDRRVTDNQREARAGP